MHLNFLSEEKSVFGSILVYFYIIFDIGFIYSKITKVRYDNIYIVN